MPNATDDPIDSDTESGAVDTATSEANGDASHADHEGDVDSAAATAEAAQSAQEAQAAQAAQADGGDDDALSGPDLLEREGEAAADYLEALLDIIDVDGDIDMDVDGDRAVVAVIGEHLRHLVGQGGAVLDALQELTRLAVARETGARSRLMLDIAGYRARRRAELSKIGAQAADKALSTGESVALNPMSAFERKVVHDAVAAAGLRSESEGVEPERYVVVLPTRRAAGDAVQHTDTSPDSNDAETADAAGSEESDGSTGQEHEE